MTKNNKDNKQLLEEGQKIRSGQILSEYLRAIGNERTEVWSPDSSQADPDEQVPELISKAEMLMRYIWQQALKCQDAKIRLDYIKLVLDRCEGKVSTSDFEPPKRPGIPNKISQSNKNRLNRMVEGE